MKVNTTTDLSPKEVNEIIRDRGEDKDFYILRYDIETTEYNNRIVFKNFKDAASEFNISKPNYKNERVELMFSPEEDDLKYGDNIVLMYKEIIN